MYFTITLLFYGIKSLHLTSCLDSAKRRKYVECQCRNSHQMGKHFSARTVHWQVAVNSPVTPEYQLCKCITNLLSKQIASCLELFSSQHVIIFYIPSIMVDIIANKNMSTPHVLMDLCGICFTLAQVGTMLWKMLWMLLIIVCWERFYKCILFWLIYSAFFGGGKVSYRP